MFKLNLDKTQTPMDLGGWAGVIIAIFALLILAYLVNHNSKGFEKLAYNIVLALTLMGVCLIIIKPHYKYTYYLTKDGEVMSNIKVGKDTDFVDKINDFFSTEKPEDIVSKFNDSIRQSDIEMLNNNIKPDKSYNLTFSFTKTRNTAIVGDNYVIRNKDAKNIIQFTITER